MVLHLFINLTSENTYTAFHEYWNQPYVNWRCFPEDHGQTRTMTRQKFFEFSENAGMCCVSQELNKLGKLQVIDLLVNNHSQRLHVRASQ